MNKSKLLYFYSDENNLENQENFDLETIDLCIINSKDTIVNYSSVYNKIKSLNIDAIIIDKSSFVLDKEIFEFATYIRLLKNNIWDVPIYIYCNFGYKGIIEFLKSDKTNISKTNRFEIINNSLFEKDALEIGKIKFFQNLEQKKQESLNWNDFIKTINVEKPETSNHTISNEWAIYRWAHAIGANDSDIEKIENKVENNIYFKYLQAIYPITEIQEIREEQLKVENLQDSKILYIDDEADKGWYEVMCTIIADINKVKDFDYLGNELKNKTQNEIIDLSIKKIKEYEAEILILDFRLHKNDFDCSIKEVTGYKLLQAIKEINPGIQVIIFSATNKVWNLQALQNAGADGFIIKESPENSVDSNFTQEVIISFIQELDKANKRRFLKEFWIKLNDLKIKSSKFDNEILIAWKLLYDSFTNQKYFNYAYLQLFLIIETFLTDENVFRKNIEGSNYVICKNGEESLVFDFIKYVNNQPKYKSAIKFRNGNYKKEIDNNFNRRLDTNAIISSILIFRYGLETSGEKNWTNIYDTRNSKAAHPEKGIVTIQELIILINFIIFLLESENLNNKNYNFSLIKPTFEESIEKLREKFS